MAATNPSRRAFLRLAAAAGLFGPAAACSSRGVVHADAGAEPQPHPVDNGRLGQGLLALAKPHERWVQGHGGAAVIAAHCFAVDNRLDERTARGLDAQVAAFIARDAGEFPGGGPGKGRADPERIVERLDSRIADLRSGGHEVIFAVLALRALRDAPEHATPAVIDGVLALMDATAHRQPERETPWQADHPMAPFGDTAELARATVTATLRPWSDVRRLGASGVLHWITHAEALVTLAELGYPEVARRGHPALVVHINHPVLANDGAPAPQRRAIEWLQAYYWESDEPRRPFSDTWLAGHSLKLPHSLFCLLRHVDGELRSEALLRAAQLQGVFG